MPSNYLANNLLKHTFTGETYTPPKTIYLAAFTSKGEVTAASYERQEITFSVTNTTATNDTDVYFPIAQEDWGEIQEYVLFDEKDNELERFSSQYENDSGNMVYPVININDQFGLPQEELTLDFVGGE